MVYNGNFYFYVVLMEMKIALLKLQENVSLKTPFQGSVSQKKNMDAFIVYCLFKILSSREVPCRF